MYDNLPIPIQNLLVTAAGWRSHRQRFGAGFSRALAELKSLDKQDADAVRADQEARLRDLIDWAARTVPYYEALFRREGIDPASIRSLDDLPRIPTLNKATLREQHHALRSREIAEADTLRIHSSGTTGSALEFLHTRETLGWEYACSWRQREWFGLSLGDRFAAFGGQQVVPLSQQEPPFWRSDFARGRVLFSLYHMKPEYLLHYAKELAQPGYRFWQGYPSSIGLVAQQLLDSNISLGRAAPKAIFTSSETLLDFHRERIQRASEAPVADRYSSAEYAASAAECPAGGLHVDTEFGVVEIDAQEETDEWVRGEIIATGLSHRAMPLIRYRTGDVATLRKRGDCPCGRARPLLERIDGRIEDFVITPDDRRVGRMDHVFKDANLVQEAQIVQPTRERLVVRLVPRAGFGPEQQADLDREMRARLGDRIEIEYQISDAIPREPNGKFRAVISQIPEAKRS